MSENGLTPHDVIVKWVEQGSSVLELGCGSGNLLKRLVEERGVKAQGIDIDDDAVFSCIEKGLNVLHEDADAALLDYAADAFDFTIFDQSLQSVVRRPEAVISEALRVSRKAIIGFSNFAHYGARAQIFFKGRTPVTASLPYEWHDTPNLHFLSIADFKDYCDSRGLRIEEAAFFGRGGRTRLLPNLRALSGYFVVSRPTCLGV